MNLDKYEVFYNKHYKKLLIIPFLLLGLSFLIIALEYSSTGDFFNKDVSLKGGITATIHGISNVDIADLEKNLKVNFLEADLSIRELTNFRTFEQTGFIIDIASIEGLELEEQNTRLKTSLETFLNTKLTSENYSTEEIGPSLGQAFFRQLVISVLIAFLFMALVIFIVFRTFIPSMAVILSAFTDMVVTLAIVDLFNVKLSSAGIAAFLLLIGYSIDTDVLLVTKILKRREEGNVFQRTISAMKTGLTMTITAIVVLSIALLITNSNVLRLIFLIMLIGLIVDIFATYLGTGPILKWYSSKKGFE